MAVKNSLTFEPATNQLTNLASLIHSKAAHLQNCEQWCATQFLREKDWNHMVPQSLPILWGLTCMFVQHAPSTQVTTRPPRKQHKCMAATRIGRTTAGPAVVTVTASSPEQGSSSTRRRQLGRGFWLLHTACQLLGNSIRPSQVPAVVAHHSSI